jgi:hypothetical protein
MEKHMMSRMLRLAVVAGILILLTVFTLLAIGTLRSEEANAQAECSLETINGTYVFEGQGVLLVGEEKKAEALPYVEAGFQTFDGEGNFDGVFSASLNGEAIASQEYFTGTYEHQGDCVYTNYAPVGDEVLEFHLYTTRKGTFMTYYAPGYAGTARKP